ncbi:MAG: polyprenyl synthetase family protein [Sedimentisphaerales bacterium]|nr:polyprenyl synthetase family protein [Sedimentisphaerales bacterium]
MAKKITQNNFKVALEQRTLRINKVIPQLLDSADDMHPRIAEAMRYTLKAPGKRIRAALALFCCELVAGKINKNAEIAAVAIEMVHTYSLIHDELPAMDDDDFRRGRPSCHKQFDEATAILTGDALLTFAFELLAKKITDPVIAAQLIAALASAAGGAGMVGGQMADLLAENVHNQLKTQNSKLKTSLEYIHTNKTAKMFEAACTMGAIAGGATKSQLKHLADYGLKIGLGFQIADDILDVTAATEQLGKTAGKDATQGKLTYPALVGLKKSKQLAEKITAEAVAALKIFGKNADTLCQLASAMLERTK